jgi:hypothetical protein
MKIAIGINIFGNNSRQQHCIETLIKLKNEFPNVELYNITFENEKNENLNLKHLPFLKKTSKDLIKNSNKNYPIAKDIFNILSEVDCDYFLYINNDILISKKLINLILKNEYESYCFSRHEIEPIQTIHDEIKPIKIEIAGFDAWCIKKEWWKQNHQKFEDYIVAQPIWDVDFALTLYNYSNCKICNLDFYIAHEIHERLWDEQSLEAKYNLSIWEKRPYGNRFRDYIFNYLVNRKPYARFYNPLPNEEEIKVKMLKI